MSKNMFAAFASDSEDDGKVKEEVKKVATKVTKPATQKPKKGAQEERVANAEQNPTRGRGARGRGRGGNIVWKSLNNYFHFIGDRPYPNKYQDREQEGEELAPREGYRGGRGARGANTRGYRGERGGRGGFRGGRYRERNEAYTHLATREEVTGTDAPAEQQVSYGGERNYKSHGGYDRRSGTGYGKEVKKGGAGRGNWGGASYERRYEHTDASTANKIAEEGEGEENKGESEATETKVEETKVEAPVEPVEPEEVEAPTQSYAEYLAQKKKNNENLTRAEGRKPEEIKVKNIEKHNEGKKVKTVGSSIKSHETHAITGIKAEIEVGFAPIGDEEEEVYDRPRGGRGRGDRGRGDRGGRGGRGRGGYQDRTEYRGGRGGRGGRGKTGKGFAATEDDFPSL
jgi:plasminogen activator inhibitor 1 RNA-binding protein